MLERWDRDGTFGRLREQNEGGPTYSFTDGPITANNPMGVHHAWGRSLKDLFQRYHAALGEDQRYQNGFDCQGLWVEVEVEKALGLNSKHEIEAYGLDRFARACRDRVAEYSGIQTAQSRRLGMWMDWERSYYTMTDPNISYIWGFLKLCHERGWLYHGPPPDGLVPALRHVAVAARGHGDRLLPRHHRTRRCTCASASRTRRARRSWSGRRRPGRCRRTSPPPSSPMRSYVWVDVGGERHVVAEDRCAAVFGPEARIVGRVRGEELIGRTYATGFDDLPAQAEVAAPRGRRPGRSSWTRAPESSTSRRAAAPRTSRSAVARSCRCSCPSTRPALFVDGYGELTGAQRARRARPRRRAPRAGRLALRAGSLTSTATRTAGAAARS